MCSSCTTARTSSAIRSCRPSSRPSSATTWPPPTTWKEFDEIGQFLTDKLAAGKPMARAFFRQPPYGQFMFQERFRNEGGKFFDAEHDEGDDQQRQSASRS